MSEHPGDRLTAYLDGALPSKEAAELAAHLAECAHCHGMLEDLLAVRRVLRAVPDPRPHPSLLPRTLARLEARRHRRTLSQWIAAGAALAALAAALNLPFLPGLEGGPRGAHPHVRHHAEIVVSHPLADITLAGYLSSALPYFMLDSAPGAQGRP